MRWFRPRLFVSYSRQDRELVQPLVRQLRLRAYSVFLDEQDIDPGDNFVGRLEQEIASAHAVVAVITEHYANSRWAQAELYAAISARKLVIPLVVALSGLERLDEPLRRMLRDVQYVILPEDDVMAGRLSGDAMDLLMRSRTRQRSEMVRRALPVMVAVCAIAGVVFWGVAQLNDLDRAERRQAAQTSLQTSQSVLSGGRLGEVAKSLEGDDRALGLMSRLAADPAQADATRMNALLIGAQLARVSGQRWYINDLSAENAQLTGLSLGPISFLKGQWSGITVSDSVFASTLWGGSGGFKLSGSRFYRTQFLASEFAKVVAVDVDFVNSKFVGATVDTTDFSKVRFRTEQPKTEGNPIITPHFAKFEKSILVSRRTPPEAGVLALTQTGDDVTFDEVLFVDCRLEGWWNPAWFRRSTFQDCVLPKGLSKEALIKSGNVVSP
jgi:uncharacterized protein YjbI with pentapeptide repeats